MKKFLLLGGCLLLCLLTSCQSTTPATNSATSTQTIPSTESPTSPSTELATEPPTEAPTEAVTRPMPETVRDALHTYTDILASTLASYSRMLDNVTVEQAMAAIDRIEKTAAEMGALEEGGYRLSVEDGFVYLHRDITCIIDLGDGLTFEIPETISECLGKKS